ncbi:MAG: hypothetical protein ACNA7V_14435 [Bacteroidales bacterium]
MNDPRDTGSGIFDFRKRLLRSFQLSLELPRNDGVAFGVRGVQGSGEARSLHTPFITHNPVIARKGNRQVSMTKQPARISCFVRYVNDL